jgi:hypothetical protein
MLIREFISILTDRHSIFAFAIIALVVVAALGFNFTGYFSSVAP